MSCQAKLRANCDFCSYMEMDKFNSLCINGTITGNRQWNFCLVMVIIDAAILSFTSVLLCLVVAANTVHSAIRFVLANILIASIAACLGVALICLRATIAINSHASSLPDVSFKIFLAISAIGGNGRSAFMAVFAVVVVVIIKCSSSAVKFKYLIVSVVVVWTACVSVGTILVVPGVVDLSQCLADVIFKAGEKLWVFTVLYFLLFVIIPCTLATVLPVYAFCYMKSHVVSENASSLKPVLKFTLFLLLGNGLGFFGNTLAAVGTFISRSANVNEDVLLDLMRLYHVSLALSLIPTPILILVYFKPVRMKLRKCVLRVCGKWCRSRLLPPKQDPMTEMMLAPPAVNNDL